MLISLKACPFCGRDDCIEVVSGAEIDECEDEFSYPHSECYTAVCNVHKGGCGADAGYTDTREKALIKWNTRATTV